MLLLAMSSLAIRTISIAQPLKHKDFWHGLQSEKLGRERIRYAIAEAKADALHHVLRAAPLVHSIFLARQLQMVSGYSHPSHLPSLRDLVAGEQSRAIPRKTLDVAELSV